MKIALVIGHRASAPGAYGSAGVPEWHFWNDAVSEILSRVNVPSSDIKVFYRKEKGTGYNQRMVDLHKEIDEWGADISISFHFNAASNPSANGHEVLYCSSSFTSKKLAEQMNSIFSRKLSNKDRGIKPRLKKERGGGFLCRGKSRCILVEPFFASHQHEYIRGGLNREALISSFVEFIENPNLVSPV